MILAQTQTYRSVEQNRESRIKPTHKWPINLRQRTKAIQWRTNSPSISGAGKTGQLHVKE